MMHDHHDSPSTRSLPTILLVEDNEAAGRGLARLLEAQGYQVTSVTNGQSALTHLHSGSPPDVLLSDVQLPDLDGRELARVARMLTPAPRVVLITGWDPEPIENEKASWGVDSVLTKPLDFRALLERLPPSVPSPL